MCGIVGFVGREEAAPILLDGLSRLEYRGYDSAGIAVYGRREGLQVVKAKGRLQVLQDLVQGGRTVHGTLGLGHTRWATHGEPSDVNSHPQVSESGRFAVVHNGIIENYMELREFLQSEGITFVSQTDTEVVAQLLEHYYDGEIAELTADHLWVYDAYLRPVEKERCHVDWEISAAEKGGYEHFMAKEIMEQPEAFRKTVFPRIQEGRVVLDELNLEPDYLRELDKLYVIACGSSYHVGMAAKYTLERLLRKPVEVTLASEFRYCDPIVTDKTLVLVISQSGETVDTLAALREAKRLGARVLSIVNVVGSTIARESDDVLYTWAGPEIAVATTKAFSTQLAVVYLIGLYCAEALGTLDEAEYDRIVSELLLIPTKLEQILDNRADIQYFASLYFNHPSIFFIGRNIDYAIGMEGSLKLKEISYIHSEAYAAGELKHGTISLIEPGTLVVALASYVKLFDKTMSNVVEVKSRGADVLGLTVDARAADMAKTVDHVIPVPDTHPLLLPSLDVVPMQLFAYYVALQRGCDIDKPRNLAKSVTVE